MDLKSNIEIIEQINLERVYLEKVSKEDVEFLYQSLKDEKITQFLSLSPLASLKHSEKMIKRYLHYWDNLAQFNYIIKIENHQNLTQIGSVSLWNISWINKRAEIGIWLLPEYWGKGFGKKAIHLIKIIAFVHLKLNRLQAHVRVNNQRSIRLFEKCRFKKEGRLSQYLNDNGVFIDSFLFAYLRDPSLKTDIDKQK
ncbi:MAG: Spermidine N(1)-acetyltransferase [Promethearchaeota archaeon]|nr:MAG: Spermidine N(1)-acetyltransferase [Candidatus Lokiarchaeota archaeon]